MKYKILYMVLLILTGSISCAKTYQEVAISCGWEVIPAIKDWFLLLRFADKLNFLD